MRRRGPAHERGHNADGRDGSEYGTQATRSVAHQHSPRLTGPRPDAY
jgi:hypothetical protein